jgi:hypothetical protein
VPLRRRPLVLVDCLCAVACESDSLDVPTIVLLLANLCATNASRGGQTYTASQHLEAAKKSESIYLCS